MVRKIYADGTIGTVLGRNPGTILYAPLAVAVDPAGTLYVGDSTFAVRAFTTAGKWTGYAGNGVPAFSGDGGSAVNAALSTVNDLAADVNGNLWIADGVRVRRVDLAGTIATVAGDGYVHSVGDGGPATAGATLPAIGAGPGFRRQPLHRRQRYRAHTPGAPRRHHDDARRQRDGGDGGRHGGPAAARRSTRRWVSPWTLPATCWWRTPTIIASC